jgi:hypothetical protein
MLSGPGPCIHHWGAEVRCGEFPLTFFSHQFGNRSVTKKFHGVA